MVATPREALTPLSFWRSVDHFLDIAMPIYLSHGWWPSYMDNPREQLRRAVSDAITRCIDVRTVSTRTAHFEVSLSEDDVTGETTIQISLVIVNDVSRDPWR